MIPDIYVQYINEPICIFGNENEEKDPKLGLKYYGPYHTKYEKKPVDRIRIGIIGDGNTISLTKRILKLLGDLLKISRQTDGCTPIILDSY